MMVKEMGRITASLLAAVAMIGCSSALSPLDAGADDAAPGGDPVDTREAAADARDAADGPCARFNSLPAVPVAIDGGDGMCTFAIPPEGPVAGDRGRVSFYQNDTTVPRDPTHTNGWDYVDDTLSAIQLYGPPCEALRSGAATTVCAEYILFAAR